MHLTGLPGLLARADPRFQFSPYCHHLWHALQGSEQELIIYFSHFCAPGHRTQLLIPSRKVLDGWIYACVRACVSMCVHACVCEDSGHHQQKPDKSWSYQGGSDDLHPLFLLFPLPSGLGSSWVPHGCRRIKYPVTVGAAVRCVCLEEQAS